jgi:hypothetical protein
LLCKDHQLHYDRLRLTLLFSRPVPLLTPTVAPTLLFPALLPLSLLLMPFSNTVAEAAAIYVACQGILRPFGSS